MSDFPKRQHWVPRFYLREFADGNGVLNVFNKLDGRTFKNAPENLAVMRDFYTSDIDGEPLTDASYQLERELGDAYEGGHAALLRNVLDELIGGQPKLNDDHKFGLAELVALQLSRTPRFRRISRQLAEQIASDSDVTLTPDQLLKQAHLAILKERKLVEKIAQHLFGFGMNILGVSRSTPLWTSDNPVLTGLTDPTTGKMTLTESQGIGREGAELYLPLSAQFVLVMFGPHVKLPDFKLRLMPNEYADAFNQMMLASADRMVFSPMPFDPLPRVETIAG